MALTATQTTQLYQILGIPEQGTSYVVHGWQSIFGPYAETYDFTAVKTAIDTRLAALSATQETQIIGLISSYFDTLGATDPIQIHQSAAGDMGIIVDYPAQRARIRDEIQTIIGIDVGPGVYRESTQRRGSYGRIIR